MNKVFYLLIALAFTSVTFAQKATDNFAGKYKTDDGGIVTITKTASGFVGIDDTKKVVLKEVKFDGKEWKAVVINPKKDIVANGEILLEGNKLKIVAHKGFLSKTIYWDVIK
jgi:adenine deaminase